MATALANIGFSGSAKVFSAKVILVCRLVLLARTSLACAKIIVLFVASWGFLTIISLVLTCTTHVPVEIVVPHSVIRHLSYSSQCPM
ncbi:MAG TPA: hypothetical protein VFZ71_09775 [Pyrinomonadaceae bacterium]